MSFAKVLEMLIQLALQASTIGRQLSGLGELIRKSRAENRDITDLELDTLAMGDDAAAQALRDAIARARAAEQ